MARKENYEVCKQQSKSLRGGMLGAGREAALDEMESLAQRCEDGMATNPRYFIEMLADTVSSTPSGSAIAFEELRAALERIAERQAAR